MTFAVAKRPRPAVARSTGVCLALSLSLFFRVARHAITLHTVWTTRRFRHPRDFLRLFMETREVCESGPRGGKERKVGEKTVERGGEAKANSRVRFKRESSCTCIIPIRCVQHRARARVCAFTDAKAPDNFR